MFSYQEGDKGSTDSGNSKHLAKIFKKGQKKCSSIVYNFNLLTLRSNL